MAKRRSVLFMVLIGSLLVAPAIVSQTTRDQTLAETAKQGLVADVEALKQDVRRLSLTSPPVGSVMAFAGDWDRDKEAQLGWMLCDGRELPVDEYRELHGAIGWAHGKPDEDEARFNIPDFGGRFLRGVDIHNNQDPDRHSRHVAKPGGNSGNTVGSIQDDGLGKHKHDCVDVFRFYGDASPMFCAGDKHIARNELWGPHPYGYIRDPNGQERDFDGRPIRQQPDAFQGGNLAGQDDAGNKIDKRWATTTTSGANETRPINVSVHWIIKFKSK